MKVRIFVALFSGLILSACSSSKKVPADAKIVFERTACYGTCPIYSLTINGNGDAVLEGKRFTDKLGTWTKSLDKASTRSLFELMNSVGWDTLATDYPAYVSDLPSKIFTYRYKKIDKTVIVTGEHPEIFDTFSVRLHNLVLSDEWIQTKAPIDP